MRLFRKYADLLMEFDENEVDEDYDDEAFEKDMRLLDRMDKVDDALERIIDLIPG